MAMPGRLTPPPLDGADRCDRCPVAARVRAVLPAGELRFCWHHAREHRHRLIAAGAVLSWNPPTPLRTRPHPLRRGPHPFA